MKQDETYLRVISNPNQYVLVIDEDGTCIIDKVNKMFVLIEDDDLALFIREAMQNQNFEKFNSVKEAYASVKR